MDDFTFDESLAPLLQMYVDQNLVITDGSPIESPWPKVRIVAIMDEIDFDKCRRYGVFEKFCKVYVRPPSVEHIAHIMGRAIEWHLDTKWGPH